MLVALIALRYQPNGCIWWRANSNKFIRSESTNHYRNANLCRAPTANVITYILCMNLWLIAFYYFKQLKQLRSPFTQHIREELEKEKSFVLLLRRRPLLFSWFISLSLYDIIKDPPIFSNAVADVQADVFTKQSQKQTKKKKKKRIYLCISFMCRVHSMGKRQQVDFFSFHFVFFALLLRNRIRSSLIASSYDCFCSTDIAFFLVNSLLGEPLLFSQAKAIQQPTKCV